jgi:hypothetical protein
MVDSVDGRFAQINRSLAVARNQSILLNIVMASLRRREFIAALGGGALHNGPIHPTTLI